MTRSLTRRLPLAVRRQPQPDGAQPREVVLVLNPTAARADLAVEQVRRRAGQLGWPEPRVLETTLDEPGTAQAEQAVREGVGLVLAGGGDGTVREVARGLAGHGIPLGVLPLGTANITARNLGLRPRDLGDAVQAALTGPVVDLDLGRARFRQAHHGPDQCSSEHLFLVLAGIGHDAATVLGTHARLKARGGWLAYAESGLRHIARRPVPMTVAVDGGAPHDVQAWSVLAGLCRFVPPRVQVFPGALLDDGLLEVLEVTVRRPTQWLPVAAKGVLGLRRDVPGLRYERARSLRVQVADPMPVQLDGDAFPDVLELSLVVVERALRVKVPDVETARHT